MTDEEIDEMIFEAEIKDGMINIQGEWAKIKDMMINIQGVWVGIKGQMIYIQGE